MLPRAAKGEHLRFAKQMQTGDTDDYCSITMIRFMNDITILSLVLLPLLLLLLNILGKYSYCC